MQNKRFILVGGKAEGDTAKLHGGVLTLSNGLVDYARRGGFDVEVINTLRSVFQHKPFLGRIKSGLGHAYQLIGLLRVGNHSGVIIFSGAGWGFYERVLLSAICRIFRVPDIFFVVDGWFLDIRKRSFIRRAWTGFLLRIPCTLAASGSNWVDCFRGLGVGADRLVTIRYWLPRSHRLAEGPKVVLPGETLRFIFVGWMIKEKGLYEILASLKALLAEYRFNFTFIGGGTLLESVRETIRVAGWETNVSAPGWVSQEQLDSELSASHVFVLPSYAEGFPMSLIEAMTNGMPAICTNVGGISDSLRDGVNGFLIPPKDVQALKRAMEFYIRNPEMVPKHSLAALEIVRANHDADTNCQLLFDSFSVAR
jgi:glycosyltransferase involved in cell wall biosynthesis